MCRGIHLSTGLLLQAVRRGSVQLIDSIDHHIMHLGERLHVSSPPHSAAPITAAPQAFESVSAMFADSALDGSALASSSEQDRVAAVSLLDKILD
jgi:hypothetical protein